ncbi:MAG TPA: alpha-L-fucosidase [Lacunisphaera sp.]|nr:alpha-L-fucosidase [Lacunisphaera sp.]
MRFSLLPLALLVASLLRGAPVTPDWKAIDQRPNPAWWSDAKFGIFIHWGPYSVPAFSKVGEYAEWYWRDLRDEKRRSHAEVKAFHDRVYGPGFTYADFIPQFRAELFDPEQWAELFRRAGAKYVVLTSKHHDGFALWPSAEANRSWGRAWNSMDTGPRRDLVGDLTAAVRRTGLKMGVYFSLYEWYNPLYVADPDLYVAQHLVPQFKDLVSRYAPSIIFADGEWEHPADTWRSTELLQWLFTAGPNPDEVVVNDRWGQGTRRTHGGYFTTEFGSGLPTAEHPWEENRGMGHSFGYSRTENLRDYNSSEELLYMLIDIVSRGGNFLLDVGPTADGRIPVIMQQRLADIGGWLEVNGEAIYGTRPWVRPNQWSEGKVKEAPREGAKAAYDIMKLTVAPDPGFAVKEIFFTQKGNTLYAICPRLPDGDLVIRDLKLPPGAGVSLVGRKGPLAWRQVDNAVRISLPRLNPSATRYPAAWVFRIAGFR